MILLITPSPRARECAAFIDELIGETTECAESMRGASKLLRNGEYSAVVVDQYLADCDPDGADILLQHAGAAVPIYINLAVSGSQRVAREVKLALRRIQREREVAHREAQLALRNELKDSITALLLSCELALAIPHVPPAAQVKMRSACELAKDIRTRLGLQEDASITKGDGASRS